MFLEELPAEVKWVDNSFSASMAGRTQESWRSGGAASQQGWNDAGVRPLPPPVASNRPSSSSPYIEGMLVQHGTYGAGRIVEVSGHGAMRKVKIRFSVGERTFIADKVTLQIVKKN